MSNLRELERAYEDLSFARDDLLRALEDPRLDDYRYNEARAKLRRVDVELENIAADLDNQSRVSRNYDNRPRAAAGGSYASSAFAGASRRQALPTDDLGSVRLKNQPINRQPVERPIPVSRNREAAFTTKAANYEELPFSIESLYPYITAPGITIKNEINGKFKDRVMLGDSADLSLIDTKEIEAADGEVIDPVRVMSTFSVCNYISTSAIIYTIATASTENSTTTMTDLLINNDSLERKFGLPSKLTPYVNSYICEILNDALVLNSNSTIIKDMSDFKELISLFTDVKTVVLKEIKKSISNVQIVVDNKEITLETLVPTIYGFPTLEKAMDSISDEAMFVSEDSYPTIFTTLQTIANASDTNVLNIITTTGKKLRVVLSNISNKAIIRKDNHAY